jgi:hypothetical protein
MFILFLTLYEFGGHLCPYDSLIVPHMAESCSSVPWQPPDVLNCALYSSLTHMEDVHLAHSVSLFLEHGVWM